MEYQAGGKVRKNEWDGTNNMKFQTPYINTKDKYKHKGVVFNPDDDLTKQCHKDECDINKIINTYDKTGILTNANTQQPTYGNQPTIDLHSALNTVIAAQNEFDSLPAKIRKKFDNDPQRFMDFVHNPKNEAKIREMGLTKVPEPTLEVIVKNEVKLQKEEPPEGS